MNPGTKAYIAREGGKLLSNLIKLGIAKPRKPPTAPESQEEDTSEEVATLSITPKPEPTPKQETVATACVPCALGHFSTSAGMLTEAVRFKEEGMTSNEILDRIAIVLKEQNALERVDLTPEKLQATPEWERDIALEALKQSRGLRHQLETIETIKDLEQAAAATEQYYRTLHREWWKRRLAQSPEGTKILPVVSEKEKEEIKKRAIQKIEEVLG